jgi:hypothetical protein
VGPALHSLIIHGWEDVERLVGTLFDSHVDLRKLILDDCYLGDDVTGILTKIVARYLNLEVLSLEGCYPFPSATYCLILCLKKLSELNLSHCKVHYVYVNCHRLMFVYVNTCSRTLIEMHFIYLGKRKI